MFPTNVHGRFFCSVPVGWCAHGHDQGMVATMEALLEGWEDEVCGLRPHVPVSALGLVGRHAPRDLHASSHHWRSGEGWSWRRASVFFCDMKLKAIRLKETVAPTNANNKLTSALGSLRPPRSGAIHALQPLRR